METKDIIVIVVSACALIASIISFYFTFRQRALEGTRGIRKSLTETVSELSEVSLAFAKLNAENPKPSDRIIGLRRLYNSQRRYLASHAEYLADQIPQLVTDIDCNILGRCLDRGSSQ